MKALIINGSRSPKGQTAQAADAVCEGLTKAGATVEQVFLPTLQIEHCRQCDENGWGLCRKEGRCVVDDAFPGLVEKIRAADAVVFATPVYYSDLSESLKAFADRLRRICTQAIGRAGIERKPMIGVCVAGGGGGGAPQCCANLAGVMGICGFDIVDSIPVRRQNLQARLPALKHAGQWLTTGPRSN